MTTATVIESPVTCLVRRYQRMVSCPASKLKGLSREIERLAALFSREYSAAKSTGNFDAMCNLQNTVRLGRGKVFARLYNKFRKAVDLPEVLNKPAGKFFIMPLWERTGMKELRICQNQYHQAPGYPLSGLTYQGKPVESCCFPTEQEAWAFIRDQFPQHQP